MITFPCAKINIGLNIIEKRPDKFHNLETCFYPVRWQDALEIIESKEFSFGVSGIPVNGSSHNNLCVKAYELLKADFSLPPVQMHLHKTIPAGAGLGGGSSDGAHTLKLLDKKFKLGLSQENLEHYAAQLGSDCPFFIRGEPVLAYGTGNQFRDCQLSLSGYYIAVIFPGFSVSTGEAYQNVRRSGQDNLIAPGLQNPINNWQNTIFNSFEDGIFDKYPILARIKEELYQEGALYAGMSGSGSAMYGIFDERPALKFAKEEEEWIVHVEKAGDR